MSNKSIIFITFFLFSFFTSLTCFSAKLVYSSMYKKSGSKVANDFFKKAFDFERNRDLKNAEKFYQKALKEDPKYIEAYDNLGRIYRYYKKYDEAIKLYKKSIQLYPVGDVARINLALIYNQQKQTQKAVKEYQEVIKLYPKHPEAHYGLANLYFGNMEFDKALKYAKDTVKIYKSIKSPHLSDIYQILGFIHYLKKDEKEAKKHFKLARKHGAIIPLKIEYDLFKDELDYKKMFQLKTDEDYKETEKYIVHAANWLIHQSKAREVEKMKLISSFLISWAEGSSYVKLVLPTQLLTFSETQEYLLVFIAGALKQLVVSKDYKSKDHVKISVVGIESVIAYYLRNKARLGTNKHVEKYIELQVTKKLNAYIKKEIQ